MPNNQTTLVVMDMAAAHTRFVPLLARSFLFSAVLMQIEQAMSNGNPVIVQDFPDSSVSEEMNCTHSFITAALADYSLKRFITKDANDGSVQIIECCKIAGFPTQHIQLCGVFTNYCIRDSALGLACALPESIIEVLRTACASTDTGDEQYAHFWKRFSQPNIVITPSPDIGLVGCGSGKARDFNGRSYDEYISL